MAVKIRSALGMAMIWLATVAGVATVAWVAIDRAGRDITGVASLSSLPAGPSGTTTNPGSGPSQADGTPEPSTTISATSGSATPRGRNLSVAGGQVSVRCTGATILLRSAQPEDGWRVEVETDGPTEVDLSFQRGGEDTEVSTEVKALCKDGTPTFTVEDHS